ncbi:putative leukotriene B4 receptor 1-like [Triplophysa rosa]|uniref:Leukotriene B4 receptor 1-like n=1 Tax=Triplophysa rosa TaxID=992332 RepID=A0A9W7X1M6_TRIRA|nr:putative leukotriene B4 receptor 1-like [Triplophysa rosa]
MTMENLNVSNSSVYTSVGVLTTSTVLGVCCALGVPGNVAVLVMLVQHLKEGSFTPKLMMSLAVSDLLSLIFLPVWIYALLNGWSFGQGLCKFFSYVVYWSLYSSVFCMTLMSVQRYLQVLYPQRWAKLGRRGENGLICGIWTLSGILGSHALIYRMADQIKKKMHCYPAYKNHQEKNAIILMETVVLFLVPFICLVCFYLRLHKRISQSSSFNSHRLTKLSVRIVVTFFIFSTPCMINNIVQIAVPKNLNVSNNVTGALFFINSCVNPFLYAFSARTLRCRGRAHSNHPHDTNPNE